MSKVENFWDKASGNYDKNESRFELIHKKVREKTLDYLSLEDVVLDYGCGTGTNACFISCKVKSVHALDISSKMIDLAKSKANLKGAENIKFESGDFFSESLKDNSYDVVIAFNIIHTIDNPAFAMKRIFDLLKNDGVFISATPCLSERKTLWVSLNLLFVRVLSFLDLMPIKIRHYRESDLDVMIRKAGFSVFKKEIIFDGASSCFVVAYKNQFSDEKEVDLPVFYQPSSLV